jgi:hypothetical protein
MGRGADTGGGLADEGVALRHFGGRRDGSPAKGLESEGTRAQ